jgi:hypothetical protein
MFVARVPAARLLTGIAASLLLPAAISAGGDPAPVDTGGLDALVRDLGHFDYRRRVAATRHLQHTQRPQVVAAVLKSAPWSDPEVAARGLRILKRHADSDDDTLRLHALSALETLTQSNDSRLAARARSVLTEARRGVLALIEQAGGSVEFTDGKSERIAGVHLQRCPGAASLLRRLRRLDALERLNLASCELSDDCLDRVAELESLKYLCLQSNPLTDAALEPVAKLDELEALYLSSTKITDAGVARLKGLSRLRVLWLNYTAVSDDSIPALVKLGELKHLRITGTRISDAGLQQLEAALPGTRITR